MPISTDSFNGTCNTSTTTNNKKQIKKSYSSSTITSLTQTSCNHDHHLTTSQSVTNTKSQQTVKYSNKCPHVILIGDIFIDDLDPKTRYLHQQKKIFESSIQIEDESDQNEEDNQENNNNNNNKLALVVENNANRNDLNLIDRLKCDDCDKYANLWMCLRDDCMYVGCGRDEKSNKHIDIHAHKMLHPLSINLITQCVWCDICSERINLELNNPPFHFKSHHNNINHLSNESFVAQTEEPVDDYKFSTYLDYDLLTQFLPDNSNESEDDYINRLDLIKNGQFGLDNMGNTCYMNAALQALSNCYAFTSYFLECSSFIIQRIQLQSRDLHRPSTFNILSNHNSFQSISTNYLNLMRQLWINIASNKKSGGSICPSDLVHTIKLFNPMFRGYQQHDSQEFLIYLMDQLHEEVKRSILVSDLTKTDDNSNNNKIEEDSTTTVQNNDIDSGVFSLKNRNYSSKDLRNSIVSNQSGDESIESYETCGEDENAMIKNNLIESREVTISTSSDLSDKLHFSDADESLPNQTIVYSNNNNDNVNTTVKSSNFAQSNKKKKNLYKTKKKEDVENEKPIYTSIVSELFDGKIISQVQCLECNHLSTTTETFQHLSLPIPSKEYLQGLHNKIITNQSSKSTNNEATLGGNSNNTDTVPYQSWLSWMMSFMKGYIYSKNIELSECLTAFFSDDDLKGDNMYSCEKCKKLTNGVKYSKILNLPEVLYFI
jgi:ubiquitin carboxyl-terminal hydrolase 20/33